MPSMSKKIKFCVDLDVVFWNLIQNLDYIQKFEKKKSYVLIDHIFFGILGLIIMQNEGANWFPWFQGL